MKIKSFLVISFLAIIILCSASFATAQTADNSTLIAQLQAEIEQLSAQLAQLQAKQESSPASSVWCYTFSDNLKAGNAGPAVLALQTALLKEGLFSVSATGTFGPKTALAVASFQEKYASDILTSSGLTKGTGYVGPATRTKLNALYGCATIPK
ncbi:MAG: peptidoglycan-binding domain-containing protein [Candidatus Staskawiczbacteria bacterium]|nr:peptidoglycan-binding domain-containing protein [Candidatus Staskawiczbacteria bacterium]